MKGHHVVGFGIWLLGTAFAVTAVVHVYAKAVDPNAEAVAFAYLTIGLFSAIAGVVAAAVADELKP